MADAALKRRVSAKAICDYTVFNVIANNFSRCFVPVMPVAVTSTA